jgi:voltage-gated potassium channel Kch
VLPVAGVRSKTLESRRPFSVLMALTRLVGGLLVLHLIEMSIWAVAFAAIGVFPDFETSLYFSVKSYTTVGYGDVLPDVSWRLVGPIEAAVGVLMLGWSTGFIVAIVQRVYSRLEPPTNA